MVNFAPLKLISPGEIVSKSLEIGVNNASTFLSLYITTLNIFFKGTHIWSKNIQIEMNFFKGKSGVASDLDV